MALTLGIGLPRLRARSQQPCVRPRTGRQLSCFASERDDEFADEKSAPKSPGLAPRTGAAVRDLAAGRGDKPAKAVTDWYAV